MCEVLELSRSGYYQWLAGRQSARQQWRQELKGQIQQIHREHAGRYGSPRITQELRDRGFCCNRKTVAKLMKEQQIRAVMHKAFVPQTTDSKHGYDRAPNLLAQDFTARRPNTRWSRTSRMSPPAKVGCTWPA